jgi:hypothetical protein
MVESSLKVVFQVDLAVLYVLCLCRFLVTLRTRRSPAEQRFNCSQLVMHLDRILFTSTPERRHLQHASFDRGEIARGKAAGEVQEKLTRARLLALKKNKEGITRSTPWLRCFSS